MPGKVSFLVTIPKEDLLELALNQTGEELSDNVDNATLAKLLKSTVAEAMAEDLPGEPEIEVKPTS